MPRGKEYDERDRLVIVIERADKKKLERISKAKRTSISKLLHPLIRAFVEEENLCLKNPRKGTSRSLVARKRRSGSKKR